MNVVSGGEDMNRCQILGWALPIALGMGVMGVQSVRAQSQLEQFRPTFDKISTIHDAADPKHTPKIIAPKKVKAGEWFQVKVMVGHEALHPTMAEHYVRYIALYKKDVELCRTYLHPVHTKPEVTFSIALEKSTTLRVLAEPNHAAAFEATHAIEVMAAKATAKGKAGGSNSAGSGSADK